MITKRMACRDRVGLRKTYHRLLWSHLKKHPELNSMETEDLIRKVRMELYPGGKREGWAYQAWIKEVTIIWWLFQPVSGINVREVLWGNPLNGKVESPPCDNPY